MWFGSLFDVSQPGSARATVRQGRRQAARRGTASPRPRLELLEDRCLLSFSPAVSYPVGAYPQAVLAADFNNDAAVDLAVANADEGSISVLLGNGDATFDPAVDSANRYGTLSLAAGDFNGDGNLDLATANWSNVSVVLGNGDGTFQAPSVVPPGYLPGDPQSVAVGDFNGDGTMDLGVLSNYYDYDRGSFSWAHVLVGNGDGTFSGPNTTFLGFGYHTAATVANLNGDGFDDFVTFDSASVLVLLGDSSGYLQAHNAFYTGGYSLTVAAGDLDADGDTDLVTADRNNANVSVLLGDGLGNFGAPHEFETGQEPVSVVLGDFTGDGKVDIASVNIYGQLSVLAGRGDGTFAPPVHAAVGWGPTGVAGADFNGDSWLDAATANSVGNDVSVLINDQVWVPADAPSVTINDVTVTEGNTGSTSATFTLTLSSAHDTSIMIHYETANSSAAAGSDYTAVSGDVTFAAGQTTQTITVMVLGDRLPEATETFVVNLTTSDAFLGDGQGIGTIVDNEPRISINNVAKKEGNGKGTTLFVFTVTLWVAYDQPVTVSYTTTNGTAIAGSDYVARSGTLTFAPGETTKTITIAVYRDKLKGPNETFFVDLFGNSSNSLLSKSRGIGTILNDD